MLKVVDTAVAKVVFFDGSSRLREYGGDVEGVTDTMIYFRGVGDCGIENGELIDVPKEVILSWL